MNLKKLLLICLTGFCLVGCKMPPEISRNPSSEPSSESSTNDSTVSSTNKPNSETSTSEVNSSEVNSSEPTSSEVTSNETSSEPSSNPSSSEPSSESSTSPSSSESSADSNVGDLGDKEQEFDFYRTVSFDSKGGSSVDNIEVIEGGIVSKPQDPVYGDYKFLGWYLDGELYNFASPVLFDITLEARWEGLVNSNVKQVNFTNSLTLDGVKENGPFTEGCLPSFKVENEDPKILVFPVRLKSSYNSSTYDSYLEDINTVFNGTSEETGWESVKTYYEKSSYGKLNLDITVWDEWFYDSSITPSSLQTMYDNYHYNNGSQDPNEYLITKILDKYNSSIDYSKYDSNSDGYIDSIWLIYDEDVNYESEESMFWAYSAFDYEWYDESYDDYINPNKARDNVYPYYYAWAGVDFMYPEVNDSNYDTSKIKLDAHTYIHETGHLLGLDDYYDYNESVGPNGGLYGADMMDYNIGDHGVITKLLLDWVNPYVPTGDGEVTLRSFTTTGDCLVISENELESIYDTYYIVEFYTNDGLNANDEPIADGLGIRITLVHGEVNIVNGEVNWNGGTYDTSFKYDNSDTSTLFVDMLSHKAFEEDSSGYKYADASNLYTQGKTFTSNVFDLEVISITSEEAIVNITLK